MDGLRRCVVVVALAAMLAIAGCPSGGSGGSGDDGTPVVSQLEGSWSGSLSCTRAQSVAGGAPLTSTSTKTLTIQFDGEGKPASVVVLGYSGGPDQSAALRDEGDTVTLTSTSSGFSVTQAVTVSDVTRTETKTTIELDIELSATGISNPNSTQTGTGTQTIEATLVGNTVEYTASVSYDVTLASTALGGISIQTLETTDCAGTLSP